MLPRLKCRVGGDVFLGGRKEGRALFFRIERIISIAPTQPERRLSCPQDRCVEREKASRGFTGPDSSNFPSRGRNPLKSPKRITFSEGSTEKRKREGGRRDFRFKGFYEKGL